MAAKYPIRYTLNPKSIAAGRSWLTLSVQNISDDPLTGLNVRLNSLDTYDIDVEDDAQYVPRLAPDEEREFHYQVTARESTGVYISLDGRWGDEPFHWESPSRRIAVGEALAELVSLFALTEPHPRPGETITCEATLRGIRTSTGLILEFWVDTPGGESISPDKMATESLPPGETATYTAEFTPEEQGIYVLHAYLFDGVRRIGHATEYITVS